MSTKPSLAILATLASAVFVAAAAAAASAPGHASLVIRHQARGCHTWSVNGGRFEADQTITLSRGGWITIVNNDVMPHTLVETSGPAVKIENLKTPMSMGGHRPSRPGVMNHMGATARVSFAHSGVYRFTTKAGEDYMPGMKTIGEDYVLRLTVKVS